jgi:uncharacterized protein YyaL (SSP411 family)
MWNMLRLSRFTAESSLEERAAKIGRTFAKAIKQFPSAYVQFMVAVDFAVGPCYEVVIIGHPEARDTQKMLRSLGRRFSPHTVILFRPTVGSAEIDSVADYLTDHESLDGKATAYVCTDFTCKTPTTDVGKMLDLIT